MKYQHLFFDLDHTLWDFDANAKLTLHTIYHEMHLEKIGVNDFERFYKIYLAQNEKLWEKYRNGYVKAEELRWKRMWNTLLEFKIADEPLSRKMGMHFLELLPSRTILFPDTISTLQYLRDKGYQMHLITNGFEETQHSKLKHSGINRFFVEVITSEGSNSLKPKKEIFDYALKKASALSHHSIMIGDSIEADVMGALNAGIDQVYMNHIGVACTVKPTYTVNSIGELCNIF